MAKYRNVNLTNLCKILPELSTMMMTVVGRKWTTTKSLLLGLCCSDASFFPWHSCNILDTSSCSVALHYSLPIDLSVLPKFAFTLTLPSHSLHTSVLPFQIYFHPLVCSPLPYFYTMLLAFHTKTNLHNNNQYRTGSIRRDLMSISQTHSTKAESYIRNKMLLLSENQCSFCKK